MYLTGAGGYTWDSGRSNSSMQFRYPKWEPPSSAMALLTYLLTYLWFAPSHTTAWQIIRTGNDGSYKPEMTDRTNRKRRIIQTGNDGSYKPEMTDRTNWKWRIIQTGNDRSYKPKMTDSTNWKWVTDYTNRIWRIKQTQITCHIIVFAWLHGAYEGMMSRFIQSLYSSFQTRYSILVVQHSPDIG